MAKFPTLGDSSSFSASNMWNQTLNLKKLGSSKLKLVDFRIESKLNEPRVEFADGKDSAVSKYQEIFRIFTLFPRFWYFNMNLGCGSYICQIRVIFDQCRSNRISWLEIRRRIFSRSQWWYVHNQIVSRRTCWCILYGQTLGQLGEFEFDVPWFKTQSSWYCKELWSWTRKSFKSFAYTNNNKIMVLGSTNSTENWSKFIVHGHSSWLINYDS